MTAAFHSRFKCWRQQCLFSLNLMTDLAVTPRLRLGPDNVLADGIGCCQMLLLAGFNVWTCGIDFLCHNTDKRWTTRLLPLLQLGSQNLH